MVGLQCQPAEHRRSTTKPWRVGPRRPSGPGRRLGRVAGQPRRLQAACAEAQDRVDLAELEAIHGELAIEPITGLDD